MTLPGLMGGIAHKEPLKPGAHHRQIIWAKVMQLPFVRQIGANTFVVAKGEKGAKYLSNWEEPSETYKFGISKVLLYSRPDNNIEEFIPTYKKIRQLHARFQSTHSLAADGVKYD